MDFKRNPHNYFTNNTHNTVIKLKQCEKYIGRKKTTLKMFPLIKNVESNVLHGVVMIYYIYKKNVYYKFSEIIQQIMLFFSFLYFLIFKIKQK